MALVITPSVTLSGTCMKHRVTLTTTVLVGETRYFHVSKSDESALLCQVLGITRLVGQERTLSKTDIVEQLIAVRNSKFESWYNSQIPKAAETAELFEGMDDEPDSLRAVRKSRFVLATMPLEAVIQAPNVGGVEGIDMKVLMGNEKKPLFLELSSHVIEYLRAVCLFQIKSCNIKRFRTPKNVERRAIKKKCKLIAEAACIVEDKIVSGDHETPVQDPAEVVVHTPTSRKRAPESISSVSPAPTSTSPFSDGTLSKWAKTKKKSDLAILSP